MLYHLLPTLALALTANAFLIPSDLSSASWEDALGALTNRATQHQVLSLDCPSCPFASVGRPGEPITWVHGIENTLKMEFAVEDKQLSLNGVPFFPPNLDLSHPIFMSTKQELKADTGIQNISPLAGAIPLSTQIEFKGTRVINGDDGDMKVHRISLETMGISDKVVRVPTVHLTIAEVNGKVGSRYQFMPLKTTNNTQFYLLPVETTPYQPSFGSDKCATVFCRVRASIASKIAALRAAALARLGSLRGGCGRGGGHFLNGPKVKGGIPKFIGKFPPKHGHHNFHGFSQNGHFNHHHHQMHGAARLFFRGVQTILIPILVGIIVGISVGGIGLLIGQAVVFLWARYLGVSHTYNRVDQHEEAGTDSPPKYEDVYVEQAESDVDEKSAML